MKALCEPSTPQECPPHPVTGRFTKRLLLWWIMKKCSKCGEEKVESEFFKQKAARDGLYSQCKVCATVSQKTSQTKHRDVVLARKRACMAEYSSKNREALRQKQALFYSTFRKSNPDQLRDWGRRTSAAWRKRNPHKVTEQVARRKSAKILATPIWADQTEINMVYLRAKKVEASCGTKMHVDHIVPLTHPLVCGLHCEANLQVLPAAKNLKKGNRYWPNMP